MICYRCNGQLDLRRDTCPKCGTDVKFFKKIVFMSNRYYNDGLAKAQARDLTGAKEDLKTSLSLYKKNTNARNLLGLVYYATGESAEALKMWVISKSYAPEKNMCDRYMNYIRRNMNSLNSEDHGIKKFNQALNYAGNNARDLAVIQLKKVLSVHPNMTKAYELLSLIYIDDKKYDQARKVLNDCLKVDHGNTRALYYLKELDSLTEGSGARSAGIVGEEDREQLIIPVRFRDFGSYLANALYIFLGVLLGIAIAWYVIVPGLVDRSMEQASSEAMSYQSEISDLQQEIAEASRKASEEARAASEAESRSIEEAASESEREASESASIAETMESMPLIEKLTGFARNNEAAITDAGLNTEESRVRFIRLFLTIDPHKLSDDCLLLYNDVALVLCNPGNRDSYREEAEGYYEDGEVRKAAELYEALSYLMPDSPEIRLRTAELWEEAGDADRAANFYWQYYWLFENEADRENARNHYLVLKDKAEIDPWTEELDKTALVQPIIYEELVEGLDIPETTPPETEETSDEDNPEGNPDENPEGNPDENPEGNPDENPEGNPDENPEQPPEENPDQNPEQPPEENPEQNPEQPPEENPEQNPEQAPEENPEQNPEQPAEG